MDGIRDFILQGGFVDLGSKFIPKPEPIKKCQCDQCDYKCVYPSKLIVHKRTHLKNRSFQCTKCHVVCSSMVTLKRHTKLHAMTPKTIFSCLLCPYQSLRLGDVQMHAKRHEGLRPFQCDICSYSCLTKACLKAHSCVHTKIKLFKCDICPHASATASGLKNHKQFHSTGPLLKCPDCSYAHVHPSMLRTHRKIHAPDNPHICEVCQYSATCASTLTHHKIVHSDILKYHCTHCDFRTKWPESLRHHLVIHETQKEYQFLCAFQDCGTQPFENGNGIQCWIRCKTQRDLEFHIQKNHTQEGIAAKFHSENKLAEFFKSKEISFDRDWMNLIQFKTCKNIEGGKISARPDFYLHDKSVELQAVVLVENDEFSHSQTVCEFQRLWNIVHALQQIFEFKDLPLVVIRFNPHFYRMGKKYVDEPLPQAHEKLLQTIQSLTQPDIKQGVNLIYINYDRHEDGELRIFDEHPDKPNDYAHLYKDCVIKIV